MNRHHIIPQSRGGHKTEPSNIITLDERVHCSIHQVFWVMLPHEQIRALVGLNSSALTTRFKRDLNEILANDSAYYYKDGLLIPKR